MLAVDTNVVVRYVLNDDRSQAAAARRLVDEHEVQVLRTVLLETEWVLRSAAQLDRERIHAILSNFAGLPTVQLERPETVVLALSWFDRGMDFADAMHLAASDECEAFATFDRKLAKLAKKAKAGKVLALAR